MKRAILFDMDGVLVDSFEAWLKLMNATAQYFDCPPVERDQFKSVYGQPTEDDITAFFPGCTVDEIERFYETHFSDFKELVEKVADAPHLLMILRHMDIRVAVITNTPSHLAHNILENIGIHPDILIGASDVPNPKPAPDMVLKACESLGVNPSEVLVVGDSVYDQEAAQAAGTTFVGVGKTFGDSALNLGDVLGFLDN